LQYSGTVKEYLGLKEGLVKKNKLWRIFGMFALKFLAVFLINKNKKCMVILRFLLKLSHCNH